MEVFTLYLFFSNKAKGPLPREYMENLYEKIVADEIKMETEGKMWSTAEKKGWLTKQGKNQTNFYFLI